MAPMPDKANEPALRGADRSLRSDAWTGASNTVAATGSRACDSLETAEDGSLRLTAERARAVATASACSSSAADGARCRSGWRERFPRQRRSSAVSNSRTQRAFIDAQAGARGLNNLSSHHRRHERLRGPAPLRSRRLGRDVRAHAQLAPLLRARGAGWIATARRFHPRLHASPVRLPVRRARRATGWRSTSSPAASCRAIDLLLPFQRTCGSSDHWQVSGAHYQKTPKPGSRTWTRNRAAILPILNGLRRRHAPMVGALAGVLHGLRGALGLRRRPRVGRIALLAREGVNGAYQFKRVTVVGRTF